MAASLACGLHILWPHNQQSMLRFRENVLRYTSADQLFETTSSVGCHRNQLVASSIAGSRCLLKNGISRMCTEREGERQPRLFMWHQSSRDCPYASACSRKSACIKSVASFWPSTFPGIEGASITWKRCISPGSDGVTACRNCTAGANTVSECAVPSTGSKMRNEWGGAVPSTGSSRSLRTSSGIEGCRVPYFGMFLISPCVMPSSARLERMIGSVFSSRAAREIAGTAWSAGSSIFVWIPFRFAV